MASRFVEDELANGLRIVIEVMPDVQSVACGFLVRTGSRDEVPPLAGVSHFLEHMCFKGTPTRTWQDINIEFDEMGSQYNAFTSKDRTFYYGWVRSLDLDRQMALIADMMRSALPPGEFDMEKNVILEEIAMSNDQIEHRAYHRLHEGVYAGGPMAWPVLGYEQTIRDLTRDRMHEYFSHRYTPDNMILIVAGNVDPRAVVATAQRLSGAWPRSGAGHAGRRTPPRFVTGVDVQPVDRFNQQALLLSYPAAPALDPAYEEAQALAAILGGQNSRFFWNIVQTGLAPRASVWHEDFQDCGLMTLYALGEPANSERLLDAIRREAESITRDGVQPHEVQRVRNKRRTALAAEGEAPYYRLVQIMEDVDYRGRPRSVEERLERVNQVTVESIAAYLRRFPITGEGHLVSIGPRAWPEGVAAPPQAN